MQAEVAPDVPKHSAGTEPEPQRLEDFRFVITLAQDVCRDVVVGRQVEDAPVARADAQGSATGEPGVQPEKRLKAAPTAAEPNRKQAIADGNVHADAGREP